VLTLVDVPVLSPLLLLGASRARASFQTKGHIPLYGRPIHIYIRHLDGDAVRRHLLGQHIPSRQRASRRTRHQGSRSGRISKKHTITFKSRSPTPSYVTPKLAQAPKEQSTRPETCEATMSRSSSTVRPETPHKKAKRSRSGHSSTPSSTKSERDIRRETMYQAALSQKWEKGFFTSVDGYHNQEPEEEL
jgi:hypothetical protein